MIKRITEINSLKVNETMKVISPALDRQAVKKLNDCAYSSKWVIDGNTIKRIK